MLLKLFLRIIFLFIRLKEPHKYFKIDKKIRCEINELNWVFEL